MPYYTGSAANMSQVRDAIVNACTENGWSWDGNTLSKVGVSFSLWEANNRLWCKGLHHRGDAQQYVGMFDLIFDSGYDPGWPHVVWPLTVRVFIFTHEVYCVLEYGVQCFLWMAFGKSTLAGIPGSGAWVGASFQESLQYPSHPTYVRSGIGADFAGFHSLSGYGICVTPGLMLARYTHAVQHANYFIQYGESGWAWKNDQDGPANSPRLAVGLSEWISESALIPIRSYASQPENKISLAVELEGARHLRIDNVEPCQIITLGNDKWMCFPWFRKGRVFSQTTSGPLGWAIRYEGP